MASKLKWNQIIVAFLCGMLVMAGFFFCRWGGFGRPDWNKRNEMLVHKFTSRLHLSGEQAASIRVILDSSHQKIMALREGMKPQFDDIRASTRNEIRKTLTPAQIPKFEEMDKEFENRRKRNSHWFGKNPS